MTEGGDRIGLTKKTAGQMCDICGTNNLSSYVDGRTLTGQWAYMCEACYLKYGTGLGIGKGQRYKKVADNE